MSPSARYDRRCVNDDLHTCVILICLVRTCFASLHTYSTVEVPKVRAYLELAAVKVDVESCSVNDNNFDLMDVFYYFTF